MTRDFHLPGRSPVFADEGMVATSHPLASVAALETLRAGGTAADAAVTAVAALGVLEPHMTGIGGDCFCLVAKPGAPVWGYNGSGRSGAAARAEALIAQGIVAIGPDSVHAVTVPGAVEAWDAILTVARPLRARSRACPRHPLCRERRAGRAARRLRLGARGRPAQEGSRARRVIFSSMDARPRRATG